jgi:hypothetical protein
MFQKRYAALFITDSAIQVAKLDTSGKKFVYYHQMQLSPGIIINGEIRDGNGFINAVKSIKIQKRIKDTKCIVGISDHKATVETSDFKGLSEDELNDAVYHRAANFLPFPVEDEYLDWMYIVKNKEQSTILVSAVPKRVLDAYTNGLISAGWAPVSFENRSLTIFRMIPKPFAPFTIAINVGFTDSTVMILTGDKLYATTVIQLSQDYLDKLFKTIAYFIGKTETKNADKKIYITGKNAQIVLQSTIGIQFGTKPEVLFTPVKNIPQAQRVEFALLGSLCQKNPKLPSDPSSIDLLPSSLTKTLVEQENSKVISKLGILFLIASIVIVAVSAYALILMVTISEDVQKYSVKVPTGKPVASTIPVTKIALLQKMADSRVKAKKAFEAIITQAAVGGITLSGIKFDLSSNTIIIIGSAPNRDTVIIYHDNLENSGGFKSISLPLSGSSSEFTIPFRMTAIL